MVVPENCKYKTPEKIIFPIDQALLTSKAIDSIYTSLDYLEPPEIKRLEINEKGVVMQEGNNHVRENDILPAFSAEIFRRNLIWCLCWARTSIFVIVYYVGIMVFQPR